MRSIIVYFISFLLSKNGVVNAVVSAPSAQEYLGRYQYYRGWSNKRRLLIVAGPDKVLDDVRRSASYGYRCGMAIRNMNLVLLGENLSQETFFFHNEDTQGDFISTRELSIKLRKDLRKHLEYLYDLPHAKFYAVLIGYDGGLKASFSKPPNFWILFDKIDRTRTRRTEALNQLRNRISCSN